MSNSKPADTAIATFATRITEVQIAYYTSNYSLMAAPKTVVRNGSKYAKLVTVREDGGEYVFGFVNRTNGDVLMAAGWSAPAKHARGNVHSDGGGMEAVNSGMPSIKYL